MSTGDGEATEIRSGPRWDAVLAAVADAEDVLELALTDDELEDGWTEALRTTVLGDVRRVRDELSARADTSALLTSWSGADAIDVDGDAPRVDALFEVDVVFGELERAERAILETTSLLEALAAPPTPSDIDQGFDDAARAQLRAMLSELRRLLTSGEYLAAQQMDEWSDALRSYGFLRAASRPGSGAPDGGGVAIQRIEQFPPGRRWERVAIFDGWLSNVAQTDVLDDEGVDADLDQDLDVDVDERD